MQGQREPAARWEALQRLGWEERLSAMGASLRQLAPVLAVSLRLLVCGLGSELLAEVAFVRSFVLPRA